MSQSGLTTPPAAGSWTADVPEPLVAVQKVSKTFEDGAWFWRRRRASAVSEVDIEVAAGETLGIVGESGSGKSTLLRIILRLLRPSSGRVLFEGRDIARLGGRDLRAVRRRMQVVFQDPTASFNPRHSVGTALLAPLEVHDMGPRHSRRRLVGETLELVGLNATFMERYPHQLSGGQRQRAAIARAIILRPALVLADEPTSALDDANCETVMALLRAQAEASGATLVIATHDARLKPHFGHRLELPARP
jgi:peptide/nickel transport system ATP-binding protein